MRGSIRERIEWGSRSAALLRSALVLAFSVVALGVAAGSPGGEAPTALAKFSESAGSLPQAWSSLTFPKIEKQTDYRAVREGPDEGSAWVVEATSKASASGLTHASAIDLAERPILRWRWKVDGVLAAGNARRKDGDDYPARVYLTFEPDEGELSFWERTALRVARQVYGDVPSRAINYVWASQLEKGAVVDSAYVGAFVKVVAVESGAEHAGGWRLEERDVAADYRKFFGAEPPLVSGVAIMTDSDDTGESAHAWYGDLEFAERGVGGAAD